MKNEKPPYHGFRYSPEIISHAEWLYHRFYLSLRDVEELLAERGVEVCHEPTRQRERQMRRFKSVGQAQRFLSVHDTVGNLFRLGRHLMRAKHYRELRSRALSEWQQVTCA